MASSGLLETSEEDALHNVRLVGTEDKLFKRLARRLQAEDSPINVPPQAPPTPPPDSNAIDEAAAAKQKDEIIEDATRESWRDEMLLDFAAYEAHLVRTQFLLRSNELERERYAAEKQRIQDDAQHVRENNNHLHEQLEAAQATLALRKTYDALADKITSHPNLKPRIEQHAAIDKLRAEISELEREKEEYAKTWAERREQFGKIVDEGTNLLRLIRDEKEEVERQEDMDAGEDTLIPQSRADTPKPGDEAVTPRPGASRATTPKPGDDDQRMETMPSKPKPSSRLQESSPSVQKSRSASVSSMERDDNVAVDTEMTGDEAEAKQDTLEEGEEEEEEEEEEEGGGGEEEEGEEDEDKDNSDEEAEDDDEQAIAVGDSMDTT